MVSEGGTRRVRRKKKNADGTYAASESYHSGDSDFYDKSKLKVSKCGYINLYHNAMTSHCGSSTKSRLTSVVLQKGQGQSV